MRPFAPPPSPVSGSLAVHVVSVTTADDSTAEWVFDVPWASLGLGGGLRIAGVGATSLSDVGDPYQVEAGYPSAVVEPGAAWSTTASPGITFAGGGVLSPQSGLVG